MPAADSRQRSAWKLPMMKEIKHEAKRREVELLVVPVCLVADPACKNFKRFGDGKGAYVNVVAWAESAEHVEERVTAIALEQLDCIVREMEQVELLEVALQREGCLEGFFTMRATAERQPNDAEFGGVSRLGTK